MDTNSINQELAKVRREVAYKKKVAEEAGLDRLLLRAYHKNIRHYPKWIKSAESRKYIYPEAANVTEKTTKDEFGETFVTEFSVRDKKYTVVSRRKGTLLAQNIYYVVELFINGDKAFAVSEKHDVRLKDEHYYTLNIEAYLNEDWVDDFRKINEYGEKIAAEEELAPSEEDAEFLNKLKGDFNIGRIRNYWLGHDASGPALRILYLLIILLLASFIAFAAINN